MKIVSQGNNQKGGEVRWDVMGQGGVQVQGTGGGSGPQAYRKKKKKKAVKSEIERVRAGSTMQGVDEQCGQKGVQLMAEVHDVCLGCSNILLLCLFTN